MPFVIVHVNTAFANIVIGWWTATSEVAMYEQWSNMAEASRAEKLAAARKMVSDVCN
jgi:hypothetical protein